MESKKPLISIICAVRNDGRFIRETLETVVSQSYPHWELIIMDAVSTDKTLDIVKEFAGKYKNIVWRSQPDQGQWNALDKALALSKGEYLMLLSGQDGYLNKNWFASCVKVFEEHPEISLVWGVPFDMSEDGKLIGPHYAYARFLKDKQFNLSPKPVSAFASKVDLHQPGALKRFGRFARKITWSRIVMMAQSFWKQEIPQKEEWFSYWLATGRPFPDGNMCIRKEVFLRNTVRFPREKLTNAALFDFNFNFNANGYFAYGLPLAANFGRFHVGGQPLLEHDAMLTSKYHERVVEFREKIKGQKM